MKRLFVLSVAMVLVLSVTACDNPAKKQPETSVTEHKGSVTSSSSGSEHLGKADIVYIQFLTDKLTESTLYQEATLNSNTVIKFNGNLLTSRKAADDFKESYNNKKQAELYVYDFYDYNNSYSVNRRLIKYLPTENKLYCISTSSYSELPDEPDSPDPDGWNLQWGEETELELTSLSFTNYGYIAIDEDSVGSEASYIQVISDYELFDNHAENEKLREKYASPIYLLIALGRTFNSADEITDWMAIFESIYRIAGPAESGGNLWSTYPDSKIPVSDMMKYINQYFEVDRQTVIGKIEHLMIDDDTLRWEDGRGGAYPYIVVTGYKENEDHATVTCRLRSALTGDLEESVSYALTVQNLTDGSFRYLSLQKVEG